MPRHFVQYAFGARTRQQLPCKSSAHRIACLALYRALLERCSRIPLPDHLPLAGPVNPIKHLIRKRFKKDVPISSPRLAVNALKVGYAAEELLRTAGDGSTPALSKIHTLLRLQHARAEASRQTRKPAPPREPPVRVGPYPGAPKLLDARPLQLKQLSGLRHVPILTQTNGYPFLRIRKPQSPYLSRVLRDKIELKDKRYKAMQSYDRDVEDGEDEAVWEEIVLDELKKSGGPRKEWIRKEGKGWGSRDGSWVAEPLKAKERTKYLIWEDLNKAKQTGERMIELVDVENKLWRQERGRRRIAKKVDKGRGKWRKRGANSLDMSSLGSNNGYK